MICENTLALYSPDQADEFLTAEREEEKKFLSLIETLRSLKEFDPEGYGELEEAMRMIRGETHLYSINLLAEYGLLENASINYLLERQERILAIVRSNKDIATISEAMKTLI